MEQVKHRLEPTPSTPSLDLCNHTIGLAYDFANAANALNPHGMKDAASMLQETVNMMYLEASKMMLASLSVSLEK